jgi:cytochrome c oxidase subunit 3
LDERGLEPQFATLGRQREAAQLGLWTFLGTELLLFGTLFIGYAYYRYSFPLAFAEAGKHVKAWQGLIMTLVLASADLCAAISVKMARAGRPGRIALFLFLGGLLGLAFIGLHLYEYFDSAKEGALPGEYYALEDVRMPGASLFFTFFWIMTGLRVLHATIGVGVLFTMGARALLLRFDSAYYDPVEIGTLYWHFVDIIWTFLFPLFHLRPRRSAKASRRIWACGWASSSSSWAITCCPSWIWAPWGCRSPSASPLWRSCSS